MDPRSSQEVTIALIISVLSVLLIFSIMYVFSPNFFSKMSLLQPIQFIVLKLSEFLGYIAINYYQLVWIYIPLGIIGLWRWSVWIFKKSTSFLYKPKIPSNDRSYHKYSIITPVYNEDPKIFDQAIRSWITNEPNEIIGVIDQSDSRCIEIFNSFAKDYSFMKIIIATKPGKRPALAEGIKVAKYKIVALVDSDTIWE